MSYLPEFQAKSKSAACPLPCSFCVRSLADFVGVLPVDLLLCPIHALCIYLARASSLPSCPRALFVSPRAPSRPFSENAFKVSSFGMSLRSLILHLAFLFLRSPLLPLWLPLLVLVLRCVLMGFGVSLFLGLFTVMLPPLSSVLEAATWSSASVFTSFYLSDVQFSSSQGFSLGPVVAAGAAV